MFIPAVNLNIGKLIIQFKIELQGMFFSIPVNL